MKSFLLILCICLLSQITWGLQLQFGRNLYFDKSYSSAPKFAEEPDIFSLGSSEIINSSTEYRTENGSSQPLLEERNSVLTNENSSKSTTGGQSSTSSTASSLDATASTQTLASVFSNESQSQNSSQLSSSAPQHDGTSKDTNSSETSEVSVSLSSNESNDAEQEGVARGKPSTTESINITTSRPESLYQKTWAVISDTYTLSILVPVAAGVVFATTIILTIAFCRCMRRCCIRRRLRKKVLPDSVKHLRPSDRARLLAESSDEEF